MADSVNINLGERKNGKSTQYVDCLHTVDDNYTAAGGIDVSAVDFEPTYVMSGLYLGEGAGNIAIEMEGGGQQILPFTVATGYGSRELDGYRIKKILTSGTTFTGKIWPQW